MQNTLLYFQQWCGSVSNYYSDYSFLFIFRTFCSIVEFFALFEPLFTPKKAFFGSFLGPKHRFLEKNRTLFCFFSLFGMIQHIFLYSTSGLGKRSFQVNATFMRSFAFFSSKRNVHCVHLRSLEVNATFTAFICIHLKWTQRSLRSFAFTWSERNVLCVHLHSLEVNATFNCVHLGLLSRQKLEKWTQMNVSF